MGGLGAPPASEPTDDYFNSTFKIISRLGSGNFNDVFRYYLMLYDFNF